MFIEIYISMVWVPSLYLCFTCVWVLVCSVFWHRNKTCFLFLDEQYSALCFEFLCWQKQWARPRHKNTSATTPAIMPWVTLLISLHCIWLAEYKPLTICFMCSLSLQNPRLLLAGQCKWSPCSGGRIQNCICLTPWQAFFFCLSSPLRRSHMPGHGRQCTVALALFIWSSSEIKADT